MNKKAKVLPHIFGSIVAYLGCVWNCDFIEKKYDCKTKSRKINRLETAFLKNCDLKMQKSVYSNRRQYDAFLKTQYFKMLTCDFKGQTVIWPTFLKITF
jgi:hypothetical protein